MNVFSYNINMKKKILSQLSIFLKLKYSFFMCPKSTKRCLSKHRLHIFNTSYFVIIIYII